MVLTNQNEVLPGDLLVKGVMIFPVSWWLSRWLNSSIDPTLKQFKIIIIRVNQSEMTMLLCQPIRIKYLPLLLSVSPEFSSDTCWSTLCHYCCWWQPIRDQYILFWPIRSEYLPDEAADMSKPSSFTSSSSIFTS